MLRCVCLDTVPHSSFRNSALCSTHARVRCKFSLVPCKYARLMSLCFTSNGKHAEILIETSSMLVESTGSSMKEVCATVGLLDSADLRWNNLTKKHSECPPSISSCSSFESNRTCCCFIDLVCEFHSMGTGYATSLCTNLGSRSTPDLQWIFS